MNRKSFRKLILIPIFAGLIVTVIVLVHSGSSNKALANQIGPPSITATLIDEEMNAHHKAATVFVRVSGVRITDPIDANEQPIAGQAHLHYQVDNGPVIATTEMKLGFHGLTSGPHKIAVALAGNDHNPLGPQQTLEVTIP